jgi:chemotaxis protein histidine kinase CheA
MRQQESVAVSTLDSDRLGSLVTRIAAEQGKQVTFELAQPECINLPAEQLKVVQDCAIQLLRNAVVHGVEPIAIRQQRGKDDAGRVVLKITQEDDGYRVSVRDDGRGIQLETIRQRAIEKGLYSAEQLDSMQATRIMSLVFESGFSTLEEADEHGGRGIGMDVVKANIQQLHGRIRVANRPGQYCEISFLIPAQVEQYEVAVAV